MSTTVLQLHKRSSHQFKNIQDKYAINSETKTFALSDGTTQSFNSEFWAEIITNEFVKNPTFNANTIIKVFSNQVEEFNNTKFEFSSNPAKASLEKAKINKGSTATFFGLQFEIENKVKLISCGDTNLFLLDSNNNFTPFPFSDVDSLDLNNDFINTEQLVQNKIDETYFKTKTFKYKSNDTIIIATDALSRFILRKPAVISEILSIEDFNQLKNFCIKYWESKELQEDDISAIIIPVDSNFTIKSIEPPNDFSFPNENEEEFIPTSLQQQKLTNLSDMQINEIRNQFNGIAQDFYQVKKKQKLHVKLLILAISLLILNFFFMYFFISRNINNQTPKRKNNAENGFNENNENIIDNFNSDIHTLKKEIPDLLQSKEKQKDEMKAVPKENTKEKSK